MSSAMKPRAAPFTVRHRSPKSDGPPFPRRSRVAVMPGECTPRAVHVRSLRRVLRGALGGALDDLLDRLAVQVPEMTTGREEARAIAEQLGQPGDVLRAEEEVVLVREEAHFLVRAEPVGDRVQVAALEQLARAGLVQRELGIEAAE